MIEAQIPLATVCVPTFNRAESLKIAVEAACAQDYPNLEVLVVDDGSTDATAEVVRNLQRADPRIRYYRQKSNVGPFANFGDGLRLAQGYYFLALADDDWITPDYLQRCICTLEAGEHIAAVGRIYHIPYNEVGAQQSPEQRDLAVGGPTNSVLDFTAERRVLSALSHGGDDVPLYGVIKTSTGLECLPVPNCVAGDWLWTSKLLLRGTLKVVPEVGYYMAEGGVSSDERDVARHAQNGSLASRFPVLTIPFNTSQTVFRESRALQLGGVIHCLNFAVRAGIIAAANCHITTDFKVLLRQAVPEDLYSKLRSRYRKRKPRGGRVRDLVVRSLNGGH